MDHDGIQKGLCDNEQLAVNSGALWDFPSSFNCDLWFGKKLGRHKRDSLVQEKKENATSSVAIYFIFLHHAHSCFQTLCFWSSYNQYPLSRPSSPPPSDANVDVTFSYPPANAKVNFLLDYPPARVNF